MTSLGEGDAARHIPLLQCTFSQHFLSRQSCKRIPLLLGAIKEGYSHYKFRETELWWPLNLSYIYMVGIAECCL